MSNYDESDFDQTARLIEAGVRVGIFPHPGEDRQSFADRVAQGSRARRGYLGIVARLAISAALVSLGIATF